MPPSMPDAFDLVLQTPAPDRSLFVMPNMPVTAVDHAIGAHAARLIPDGGTVQLGIGALSDAIAWMLTVRHRQPDAFRRLVADLQPHPDGEIAAGCQTPSCNLVGGDGPFTEGLYAASEMFVPGLLELFDAGILSRRAYDHIDAQRRALDGDPPDADDDPGHVAHAGFFIGPGDFYRRLRTLDSERRALLAMTGIERVNSALNVTLDGATASAELNDGRVVSGVGGQFDFVEMARRLPGARSIILVRATRDLGEPRSNIVLDHRHVTCPAHLRDLVVTEYDVADLRHLDALRTSRSVSSIDPRALLALALVPRRARPLLDRMGLRRPSSLRERLERRLVAYGLAATGGLAAEPIARGPDLVATG